MGILIDHTVLIIMFTVILMFISLFLPYNVKIFLALVHHNTGKSIRPLKANITKKPSHIHPNRTVLSTECMYTVKR